MAKKEFKFGRFWGLRDLNVVVRQHPDAQPPQMIVVSRHRMIEAARRLASEWARKLPGELFAALELMGSPHEDYRAGDVLRPDDICWPRVEGRCSECCANCAPKSLTYQCPILRGPILCVTVAESIAKPLPSLKLHTIGINKRS